MSPRIPQFKKLSHDEEIFIVISFSRHGFVLTGKNEKHMQLTKYVALIGANSLRKHLANRARFLA